MNMTLKDGTTIPIVDGSYTGAVVLIADNRQALMDIWDQLTPDNLQELKFTQDDGTVVHILHGAVIDSQQSVTNPDGTLTVHFYLSETITGDVPTDAEYALAAKIMLGEEV
ncbi:hypothetical protein V8Q34_27280 [Blautia sp. JLR.GB0024]|uniref:hypothetical protein n=1 Tax=Blautia sp. JLR.GB0024 TaxID=3123295 RepID=UPI0030075AF9